MKTQDEDVIRSMARGLYDLQKLRIAVGNRICNNFRVKLGIPPGTKEKDAAKEKVKILKLLRLRYERITDGIITITARRDYDYDGVISNYAELSLVRQYVDLFAQEKRQFTDLKYVVEAHPLWKAFLKDVVGCGPMMAGVIISEIDIEQARYVSSLWKYAGLDLGPDGRGRSRRKEHLVERTYINRDGEEATRMSLTYNPLLKTKLVGVLASSFLRSGSPYRQVYDDYKHRLESHATYKDAKPKVRHRMAIRKMVKQFLADLYNAWRPLEGLDVFPPYAEAKLNLVHSR